MNNQTTNNITLYFINPDTSNITAFVYDELGNLLPNAIISVYRFSTASNSYVFEQQAATNFQGKTILFLYKNNVYYRFNIMYNNVLRLATDPTYILDDTISFNLKALNAIGQNYFTKSSVTYSLSFNSATNAFRFNYVDTTGNSVTQGCLDVERLYNQKRTDLGMQCVSGFSNILLYNITPINNSIFTARAYVYYGGASYFLDQLIQSFGASYISGNSGLLLIVFVTIVFASMGLFNPIIAILFTPLPMIFGSLIHIVNINVGILLFIEVIAIFIAFVISKRS